MYVCCLLVLFPAELKKQNDEYSAKVASNAHEKRVLALAWNVDDLQKLSSNGRDIRTELGALEDILQDCEPAKLITLNVAKRLVAVQRNLTSFIRGTLICVHVHVHCTLHTKILFS